ncbi:MAG: glycosyltransferase family 4 protein [Chitinophagaceae bacterium]
MGNKKVLIVTYYWPPSGGAAVQRWLSFANKLAAAGWEVHLLTVEERYATYQLRDESLISQIDPRITVHTTRTFEPFRLYQSLFGKNSIPKPAFANESQPSLMKKISRFIRGNFFIPDPRKGWKRFAVPKALHLLLQHEIKNIITAGPPHSTHFIGKQVKEKTNVKWIADFHDLWTDVIYYHMLYHLPQVKKYDLQLERSILESADVVVTVGEKYRQKLLSKSPRMDPEKLKVIPIGYDEGFFEDPGNKQIRSEEFTITYTGSIADFYDPQVLLDALKSVLPLFPSLPFTLRFVGVLSGGIKQNIIDSGLERYLQETGYLPHQEALSFLVNSSVLLLVNPVTKDEDMVIPGKLYEYLAAQKPIINITRHTAETATIITRCSAGKTFERQEQALLEEHLKGLIATWLKKGNVSLQGNEEAIASYSRKLLADQLAYYLD